MRFACVILAGLVLLAPGVPQARDAQQQGILIELAGVLGESHALRQACAGREDQYWRARMMRLLEVEQAPAAVERALTSAFNNGYESRRRSYPVCTPTARRAEAAAAARGRSLARRLSQEATPAPTSSLPGAG